MALSQEEKQIVEFGRDNGKTKQEVISALESFRSSQPVQSLEEQPSTSRIRDIPSDIVETGRDIRETIARRGEKQREILEARGKGEQGFLSTAFQTTTNFATTVTELGAELAKGAVKVFTSPKQEAEVAAAMIGVGNKVLETPEVRQWLQNLQDLKESNPEFARNIIATMEGGEFLLEFLGLKAIKTGAEVATKGAKVALEGTEQAIKRGIKPITELPKELGEAAVEVGKKVKPVAKKAGEVVGAVGEGISDIPRNVITNVAKKQAERTAVKELGSETAKRAVRDGVDIADVRIVSDVLANPKNKTVAKELLDTVKKFNAGDRAVDPLEIVGGSITDKLKQLNTKVKAIGIKLGNEAKNLGKFTSEQLRPAVLARLKKVPGLKGLKTTPLGVLDFSDTVLASALSKSKTERTAIRKIYKEAISGGTGRSKHLLRQELFEILGGKKKALSNITKTQEEAFNAIRGGLLDILGSKNKAYKALSTEFAISAKPLSDLRKLIKDTGDVSVDILDMTSGVIARRLTGTSVSRGTVQNLLNTIDELIGGGVNTAQLQELYNVLNNYFDIAPRTGFQGQVKAGVEGSRGISEAILKKAQGLAGETPAVRQKAIEDLINELL